MSRRDFLVELGTEELPPKTLVTLMRAFAAGIEARLGEHDLDFDSLTPFATPRRLAVLVRELVERQPDREVERRGPPLKIAWTDDGQPTKAAEKFMQSCGIGRDELSTVKTDKGEWLCYRGVEAGRESREILPVLAAETLAALPIARRMRWGSRDEEFVRPVHWAVMLFGSEVLEAQLIGVRCGRVTRGHRFHAPAPIELEKAADYESALRERGRVIADFAARRALVKSQIDDTAAAHGGTAVGDDALLDEVTALVEWPVPVAGEFPERFLKLPREVLISTLQDHQRYFPVQDERGALLPWFITLSNIDSSKPALVKDGNERVVLPRLADAEFFYARDIRTPLAGRCAALADVVFQKQLGTLRDKSERVGAIAVAIAEVIGGDTTRAATAAEIGKCDLLTHMVQEFPQLQGTMGRYYASHDGQPDDVAAAMEEQYRPRFAGDALPQTRTGQALALADKIDTLTGIFAIGKKPTGTRDPFGLRRAALGVLRILIEGSLDVDLRAMVARAADALWPVVQAQKKPHYASAERLADDVFDYMQERLRSYFLDDREQGIDSGMFEAVLATAPVSPLDFAARLHAVRDFMALEASASLSAANKRIANILRSNDEPLPDTYADALLVEASEKHLADELARTQASIDATRDKFAGGEGYAQMLGELAALREPVDRFFEDVLVMAEDPAVRGNRLALLSRLRRLFLHTADFSKIQ